VKTIDLEPYAVMDSAVREFFPHGEAILFTPFACYKHNSRIRRITTPKTFLVTIS